MVQLHKMLRPGALLFGALSVLALPLAAFPSVGAATTTRAQDNTMLGTQASTTERARIQDRIDSAKTDALKSVEQIRQKTTTQTQEQRQLACQNRLQATNSRMNALKTTATTQLGKLDDVYSKLKTYQSTNNVQVANYATLVATADAARLSASDEILALNSAVGGVDCTSADVAVQLGTVKQTALSTRDMLMSYRTALHNILTALAQATTTTTTTTGGTQ